MKGVRTKLCTLLGHLNSTCNNISNNRLSQAFYYNGGDSVVVIPITETLSTCYAHQNKHRNRQQQTASHIKTCLCTKLSLVLAFLTVDWYTVSLSCRNHNNYKFVNNNKQTQALKLAFVLITSFSGNSGTPYRFHVKTTIISINK